MQNCNTPRRAPPAKQTNAAAPAAQSLQHRADGRKANELRRVYLELGVVSQAAGSAYVELDHTKVVCAVYGPHAQAGPEGTFSEGGQLRCDFKIAPFATSSRPEARGQTDDERELSLLLQQTLEASVRLDLLTKSTVDVYVTVLASDGGVTGAAVVCASLALANASIELFDLVSACTVGCRADEVYLDPTQEELKAGSGSMMIAVMPGSQEVTQWWQEGRLKGTTAVKAIELCMDGAASMHALMKAKLTAIQE